MRVSSSPCTHAPVLLESRVTYLLAAVLRRRVHLLVSLATDTLADARLARRHNGSESPGAESAPRHVVPSVDGRHQGPGASSRGGRRRRDDSVRRLPLQPRRRGPQTRQGARVHLYVGGQCARGHESIHSCWRRRHRQSVRPQDDGLQIQHVSRCRRQAASTPPLRALRTHDARRRGGQTAGVHRQRRVRCRQDGKQRTSRNLLVAPSLASLSRLRWPTSALPCILCASLSSAWPSRWAAPPYARR
jgi:hypothetical protein